jgi:hypothetical protein
MSVKPFSNGRPGPKRRRPRERLRQGIEERGPLLVRGDSCSRPARSFSFWTLLNRARNLTLGPPVERPRESGGERRHERLERGQSGEAGQRGGEARAVPREWGAQAQAARVVVGIGVPSSSNTSSFNRPRNPTPRPLLPEHGSPRGPCLHVGAFRARKETKLSTTWAGLFQPKHLMNEC